MILKQNSVVMKIEIVLTLALSITIAGCSTLAKNSEPKNISGIYPSLAYYNNEGECGTGAVVPWAGKLWVITYGPHLPNGSSDKLYEISPDYTEVIRRESIGGTPANRMIHDESGQLFIGPYVIDSSGNVRVIPYSVMPGRLTGNARHLTDPAGKIYYGTMEEGFYEVDVNSLEVTELYPDGNGIHRKNRKGETGPINDLLPGVHGKGLYSGQGHLFFANNGEGTSEALRKFDVTAGVLAEWDGKDWKVVKRNQFTDITGPGGINGNKKLTDPIWAIGWDYKSLILGVRDNEKGWAFFRLPKASHSYDGAHGWNTEWPRIRNVGTDSTPEYLMTMHGMFWHFPETFSVDNTAGIAPRSAYLKVIGDFARWGNRLVFGCDDSAKNEFLNKRAAKGEIGGAGQSNSNLWFTSVSKPDELGPATAEGAVWEKEFVKAGSISDPYLFNGWTKRCCWVKNFGSNNITLAFELDKNGNNTWRELKKVKVPSGESAFVTFSDADSGEWIRVKSDTDSRLTVSFNYTSSDNRRLSSSNLFKGLARDDEKNCLGGLLYGLGQNRRSLGILASRTINGSFNEVGYYELDSLLNLVKKNDEKTANHIRSKFAIPKDVIDIEDCSVLIVDDKGRRWRLPLGDESYRSLTNDGMLRICREVATERDLFSCMGTFYELPAENADGYAKIRPISSHHYRINDYASYRGLLVMTGVNAKERSSNKHIIVSDDGQAAVWVGTIDDLWELGRPVGHGGPWYNSSVAAGEYSDPYLIGYYVDRELTLSQKSTGTVNITMEVDPTGNGDWMKYKIFKVSPDESVHFKFPDEFQARWIRFVADKSSTVSAWLDYK